MTVDGPQARLLHPEEGRIYAMDGPMDGWMDGWGLEKKGRE